MRDTVDGLKPRICARLDCVISSNADARKTAPVSTRRGAGVRSIEARGMQYLWKDLSELHSTEISETRQMTHMRISPAALALLLILVSPPRAFAQSAQPDGGGIRPGTLPGAWHSG